jgi:hypothetical protein
LNGSKYTPRNPDAFEQLCRLLVSSVGPDRALTIDAITERLGLACRRETEALIQEGLPEIPFLVVADSHGYYRPATAAQVNAYRHSLRRRHGPLVRREQITERKALAAGYVLQGDDFVEPMNNPQLELIS